MAIDSLQKRMAAMNPGCPWRGPLVDASTEGFGAGNRSAALFLYSEVDEPIIISQPPPIGPTGRVYGNNDVRGKNLPPPRRRRRRRREMPPLEPPAPTSEEIEAEKQARLERVARGMASDRAEISTSRALVGLPDPDAIATAPTLDWDAIANHLVDQQQRLRDEEEAEILLMAM